MSKEYRKITVGFTVNDCENLPKKNGEQMYADDVVDELSDFIDGTLRFWYATRGKDLLAAEPIL